MPVIDARVPVTFLNLAWHRLEWPSIETFSGEVDVVHSMHPLLMPAQRAAQVVTIHDLYFLDAPENTSAEIRRDYPSLGRIARQAGRRGHSRVLLIWARPDAVNNQKIETIRAAWKVRFAQESVMRVDETSCVSF